MNEADKVPSQKSTPSCVILSKQMWQITLEVQSLFFWEALLSLRAQLTGPPTGFSDTSKIHCREKGLLLGVRGSKGSCSLCWLYKVEIESGRMRGDNYIFKNVRFCVFSPPESSVFIRVVFISRCVSYSVAWHCAASYLALRGVGGQRSGSATEQHR